MATTLEVQESAPAVYPAIPEAPAAISAALVWRRIESYVACRWTPRTLLIVAEGPGDWRPPIKPFTLATIEIWGDGVWSPGDATPTPLGGLALSASATYRISGVAGGDNAPTPDVLEAARRLACFLSEAREQASAAFLQSESLEGIGSFTYAQPTVVARALIYSGAADLLRPYREHGNR